MAAGFTWKEKGRRIVLKPSSLMRHAIVSKFCVIAFGPCHRPSTDVEAVSKPNLRGSSAEVRALAHKSDEYCRQ